MTHCLPGRRPCTPCEWIARTQAEFADYACSATQAARLVFGWDRSAMVRHACACPRKESVASDYVDVP